MSKYRARIKFRNHDLDESQEVNRALDETEKKFLELGVSSISNGIQYKTEIEEDVLGFKAAANIIIQELNERVKELDFSQIKVEIETSPQCGCGYEQARIDDESCPHCGDPLNPESK